MHHHDPFRGHEGRHQDGFDPENYGRSLFGFLMWNRIQSLPEEEQARIRRNGNIIGVLVVIGCILFLWWLSASAPATPIPPP